jgi:hypothetical protein
MTSEKISVHATTPGSPPPDHCPGRRCACMGSFAAAISIAKARSFNHCARLIILETPATVNIAGFARHSSGTLPKANPEAVSIWRRFGRNQQIL